MRGLIFRPEHILKILDGTKTETRRIGNRSYPQGEVLFCKEPFRVLGDYIEYKDGDSIRLLDGLSFRQSFGKRIWYSPLFMPCGIARAFITVKSTHAESLHDIDDDGAISEGINLPKHTVTRYDGQYKDAYQRLWNQINGHWEENPQVTVVKFYVNKILSIM
jgi:hypothetical protein